MINEKSQGKEGGRIVRKLIAEWIEAKVQREISERPGDYRSSAAVIVDYAPNNNDDPDAAPAVTVRFQ